MSKIRNANDPSQRQQAVHSVLQRPIPPRISQDAVARSILDSAREAETQKGAISKADLEAMLKRAMTSQPGQMNEAAAEAIDLIVAQHKVADEARPLADIVREAKRCRDKGVISETDLEGMMRRAWDPKAGKVDAGAATALRFVGWRDAKVMDAGAKTLMSSFVNAWYQDMVESPALKEGRRQLEQQLAQDKRDFREFVRTDKANHEKVSYDDFKHKLKDDRVEVSEWQTLMLWLQTGAKRNPISS